MQPAQGASGSLDSCPPEPQTAQDAPWLHELSLKVLRDSARSGLLEYSCSRIGRVAVCTYLARYRCIIFTFTYPGTTKLVVNILDRTKFKI